MPNQIARLRKKGNLDEAYQRALDLMQEQSSDIRVRRAYAWVLYDLTKKAIRESDAPKSLEYYETYEGLELTPEDVMLHENFSRLRPKAKPDNAELVAAFADKQDGNYLEALIKVRNVFESEGKPAHLIDEYAWAIFRLIKSYLSTRPIPLTDITSLLNEYRALAPSKSSVLHSQFLRIILKLIDIPLIDSDGNTFDLLEYLEWWNIDNLRSDDFKPFLMTVKGKQISVQPVAASAYGAIAGLLIDRYEFARNRNLEPQTAETLQNINLFLDKINAVIKAHPNYDWLPYYRIKLQIALGENNPKIEKDLQTLVRRKRKEVWAWSLLGDYFAFFNTELAIASYTKALTTKSSEEALIKIRLKLAKLLLGERRWIDAKTEIETVRKLFEEREWTLPAEVNEFMAQDWYERTRAFFNNNNLYRDTKWKAEEFVFGKAPTYTAIITRIDTVRGVAFFVVNKEINGRLNIKEFQKHGVEPGKIFDVALEKKVMPDKTIQFKASRLMPASNTMSLEIAQPFNGQLKINPKLGFGFVGQIYVHPDLITQKDLRNYQNVDGLAVIQYDPKKQTWGWSAVAINS